MKQHLGHLCLREKKPEEGKYKKKGYLLLMMLEQTTRLVDWNECATV